MLIIFFCSAEFSSLFYDVLLLNVNRKFALQTNYYNLPHGCTLFQYYLSSMICTLISISLPLCSLSLCSPLHPSDLLFPLLLSRVLCSLVPLCCDLFPSASLLCAPSLSPSCSTSLSFYSVIHDAFCMFCYSSPCCI